MLNFIKSVLKEVIIYTDGACLGNPGPGGYAVVLLYGDKRKELSGGFRLTTNNRMEILAAVEALRELKSKEKLNVTLHSDSRLLTDSVNKGWLEKWEAKNWKRSGNEKVLNKDLWLRLLDELDKHNVKFKWVQAHVGIPENERCDVLSKMAAEQDNNNIDVEYEKLVK